MPIITFLSDFGYRDHYVASVKARLLSSQPNTPLVDISHAVEPFDIAHAVYILSAVFRDFPEGTVHLVAVDTQNSKSGKYHAAKFQGHYFLAADNGIISLLTDSEPEELVEIATEIATSSPTRDWLGPAALHLASGGKLEDLGPKTTHMRQLLNRQLRLNDNAITGHVIHVDHYGNLITNITRDSIETIGHERSFTISFAREKVNRISERYTHQPEGECVCVYNSQNFLCIGINKGSAAELLGLDFDSQVDVHFPIVND
ncbi:SAM-dependent chlorinase/fluorinase [Adhaeribacter sp. BT258]|uniref:SAM-dependent chlorinase/fluorinase n=1 Tax=Adhaeribacter terrigena TaxID=2793070 RepID=A0ABS1BYD3_9BACT|nr:SAM-dependent chlorinase/fluorinase [Adhaeribacter terrigena]MBK0402177.1 SAM-dependent chlorinase/fluorinase [Adhaeribacter terrigena]